MNRIKTIVWDVDDVLNDLMHSWFLSWCEDHPGCTVRYGDLKENPPHEILGVTLDSYLRSLDAFRLSPSYQNMVPIQEVRDWFIQNGSRFRHIALTAVPLRAASFSAQWVFRNFGIWIRAFHFVPSKREEETIPQYDRDKTTMLQHLGKIDLFIDDHVEHVVAAQKAGINSLIFPRPWNRSGMSIAETLAKLQT
jgi:FMN phosphatase YigB (HAD superfamily)